MPANMMSGQASPVAHLTIVTMIIMIMRIMMVIVMMTPKHFTLTDLLKSPEVSFKKFESSLGETYLKRTSRLWKMCRKLLCLSMAVRGSIT